MSSYLFCTFLKPPHHSGLPRGCMGPGGNFPSRPLWCHNCLGADISKVMGGGGKQKWTSCRGNRKKKICMYTQNVWKKICIIFKKIDTSKKLKKNICTS
jgi:hypothetical protein